MRRYILSVAIIATAMGMLPAHADSVTGSVVFATFTSPQPSRLLYSATEQNGSSPANGILGHVLRLSKTSGPFTLTRVGGATGVEDFDITFYASIGSVQSDPAGGVQCAGDNATCTGTIPTGAKFAVVTLTVGFNGSFRYSTPN